MKVYQTNELRNIALLGGAKAGKTTMAEAMLFQGGLINRRGSVDDKNTVSDYRDIELERQNSISSTILYTEHKNHKINMIDAPGFRFFVGEVIAALRVIDTAFMVIDGQHGVEVGTEINWRHLSRLQKPTAFVINQMDHEKVKFDDVLRQVKEDLSSKAALVQYPVNAGPGFNAIIDLFSMKLYKYPTDGGNAEVLDIPAEEKDKAEELQAALIESAAEGDEALMEKFFEEGTLSPQEVLEGVKKALINRDFFPVLCASGKQNMGIDLLMDFILNIAPNPSEAPAIKTKSGKEVNTNADDPDTFFVFKTSIEQHLGEVNFFRVYGGVIHEGMDLINTKNEGKERIPQLFLMAGKNRQKIEKVMPGDIAAAIKLKDVRTNETLTSPKNGMDTIEPIEMPEPVYTTAIKAVNSADEEKLGTALNELHKIDPTLGVEYSRELRQIILSGQGEQHINTAKWYLNKTYGLEVEFMAPKIPYRETITKQARASYRHKKQSGGSGQFGEVHMVIQPYFEGYKDPTDFPVRGTDVYDLDWGGKLIFNNCIVGGAIDARFMPAILKGINERMERGPLTGSYARDIAVYIHDGKMHPVDSNEISFKLAGRFAFIDAFKKAGPQIMEPIYDVEVLVPEEMMGAVMTDLQGRRAIIMGMEGEGKMQRLKARVPLAEMNKYSTSLSSITSGRAIYSMKYADYAQVPSDVQDKLLKEYEASLHEEE